MANDAFSFSGNDAINYDSYLGPLLFEPSAGPFLSFLDSEPVNRVLEMAAGTGRLTRHLRDHYPLPAELVASDISSDMLAVSRSRLDNPDITYQVADAQDLPFADGWFDRVVCQYGLMFLRDRSKGFSEAFRVLKPGGRFIFSTWDNAATIPLWDLVLNQTVIPFFSGEDPNRFRIPFSMHDPAQLLDLLKTAGFQNNKVEAVEFKSGVTTVENVLDAILLKHPLGREVASRDPDALQPMADELQKRITAQFGTGNLQFDLRAFVATGTK